MPIFDISSLDVLNDILEFQALCERSEAGGEARWTKLQALIKAHPSFKSHLEKCLNASASEATDYILGEIAYEMVGFRAKPSLIRAMRPEVYDQLREPVENAVGTMLTLYRERAVQDKPRKRLRAKKK